MTLRKSAGFLLGILAFSLGTQSASAQGWSDKLFDRLGHDFGYVPRGKIKTNFVLTNKLDKPLHISNVASSCTLCSVAKPDKEWLQPGETTGLEATWDATKFTRDRSVAITVTFDQPSYGQTRLILKCYSRTDIVISPGEAALGTVKKGTEAIKPIAIDYAGDPNWKIATVTCTNPYLEVDLKETRREGSRFPDGKVGYVMQVRLKPDAPPGLIRERIILGVNDAYNKSIEVALHANVQSDVSLSPPVLSFGSVQAGRNVTKQVLVHGVRPFRIVEIEGSGESFKIKKPNDAKQLHVLTVELQDGQGAGTVSQDFKIKTDMEGEDPLKLSVSATVIRR
ncbi:MAG: DUF1573 domain-containing protein [Planctomycetes bacterium]|nr:DUF1573 domain-containing protein [Planctomycetota bacterium]